MIREYLDIPQPHMLTQHTKKPENKNIPGIQNLNPILEFKLLYNIIDFGLSLW